MFGFGKPRKINVNTIDDLTRIQKKHGNEAIKIFQELADEGNAVCQKFMAQSMMHIMNSPNEPSLVNFGRQNYIKYSALSAESGDIEEQFNLALFHFRQVDVEKGHFSQVDIEHVRIAAHWMRCAADAGFQPAKEKVEVCEMLAKVGLKEDDVIKERTEHTDANDFEEGQRLFELGVGEAIRSNFKAALDYYSQSIEAYENPVAYLNRARILSKKIRHFEALDDLSKAKLLDSAQGNESRIEIENEINKIEFYTENYRNGVREQLLADYQEKDEKGDVLYIARRIFCVAFGVEHTISEHTTYNSPLVEFHFFNELDNVKMFEDLEKYPDVKLFLQAYPADFIQMKLNEPIDHTAYNKAELILNQFLCSYNEDEMRYIRRNIIYDIHSNMIDKEYGYMRTMESTCPGVTKQAYEYLIANHSLERGMHVL